MLLLLLRLRPSKPGSPYAMLCYMLCLFSAIDYALVLRVVLLFNAFVSSIVDLYIESTPLYIIAHSYNMSVLVAVKALCDLAFPNI